MEAIQERAPDEVHRGGASQRGRRLVGIADVTLVDDEDGGGGALEDGAEHLLAREGFSATFLAALSCHHAHQPDADGHAKRHEPRHHDHGRQAVDARRHPRILLAETTSWRQGTVMARGTSEMMPSW